MSDARSLLRAHKATSSSVPQVQDPYASTTARGELRCSICVVPVKHWAAHTASKQHRTSLQRVKADQEKAAAKAAKRRKPVQTQDENNGSVEEEGPALPIDENDSEPAKKKTRTDAPSSVLNPVVDAELDSFLSSLSALPTLPSEIPEPSTSTSNPKTQTKKPYKPSQQETQTAYESAPSLILPNTSSISAAPSAASNPFAGRLTVQEDIEGPVVPTAEDGAEDEEEEETEPERRARLEREEREEIMDRLEEESRAQEDADERVQSLKARMEAIKRMRKERLAKKTTV